LLPLRRIAPNARIPASAVKIFVLQGSHGTPAVIDDGGLSSGHASLLHGTRPLKRWRYVAIFNDELAACAPFLADKLAVIQPKVILSLGSVATQALLRTKEAIGKLRGRVHPYGDAVLIPTFHPAFLLRNPGPEYKRMAWEDLKLARREYDKRKTR